MEGIQNFDKSVLEFIRTNMRSSILDFIMPFITKLGNGGMIWIVVALAFIKSKQYRTDGFMVIGSLLFCILIGNFTIKPLVSRLRPCDINTTTPLLISRPTDYSFPSGHTMSSFAAASVIFHANTSLGIAALILASLIAFSRLYLFVHYPSDIIVGVILGIFISVVVIWFFQAKMGDQNYAINEESTL
jgi:undecaprenyl-diphosphatase